MVIVTGVVTAKTFAAKNKKTNKVKKIPPLCEIRHF
jgi:hypothetical protein